MPSMYLEGEIVVRVVERDDHVLLKVIDTGLGIPPTRSRTFRAVLPVADPRLTHEGTGIGSRWYMSSCDCRGKAEVRARSGRGAHLP